MDTNHTTSLAQTAAPDTALSATERLDALEFLLGHALLAIEADSAAQRAKTARLETAIAAAAPGQLAPAGVVEQGDTAFTLDALGRWVQSCLQQARLHSALTPRQLAAIGETTERVLGLGEALTAEPLQRANKAAP